MTLNDTVVDELNIHHTGVALQVATHPLQHIVRQLVLRRRLPPFECTTERLNTFHSTVCLHHSVFQHHVYRVNGPLQELRPAKSFLVEAFVVLARVVCYGHAFAESSQVHSRFDDHWIVERWV